MIDLKENAPVKIHGKPDDDWRFYRRHPNGMVELWRRRKNGSMDFKMVKEADIVTKPTVQTAIHAIQYRKTLEIKRSLK